MARSSVRRWLPVNEGTDELEERLRSHYESLTRAIGFTRAADGKAAPALALQVALVGTLAARFERLAPMLGKEPWGVDSLALAGLLVLYAISSIGVVAFAASVYVPRTPRTGGSLIYFEDVAAMSLELLREQATSIDTETIERQLLDQIHTVSRIASTKMCRVRWAYYLSVPSVVFWVILLSWGSF